MVAHADIGSVQDEQGAELGAALLGSLVERREVPAVGRIHQAVVPNQHCSHIHMLQKKKKKFFGWLPALGLTPKEEAL